MSYLEAAIYFLVGYYLIPKNRVQVPMMQMGLSPEQLFMRAGEFVMYEAAAVQFFKATACMVALDWSVQ